MSMIENVLNDLLESQVEDNLIQEDPYYQMFATPLKSASAVKQAHKDQLIEFFKLTDLRNQLERAPQLVFELLPIFTSLEEFDKIKNEFNNCNEHLIHFVESINESSEKPITFQEMLGFSNQTLLRIYDLGSDLVAKEDYENALTIFIFLTTMAPHVESYWIASGVCLQALNRQEEAISFFNVAKSLNPDDPSPFFYIIECHSALKDEIQAKLEINALKEIVKNLPDNEKQKWEQRINQIII